MKNRYKQLFKTYENPYFGIQTEFYEDTVYISDGYKVLVIPYSSYWEFFARQRPCFPDRPGDQNVAYKYINGKLEDAKPIFREIVGKNDKEALSGHDTKCIIKKGERDLRILCTRDFPLALNNNWFEKHMDALDVDTICCRGGANDPVDLIGKGEYVMILPIRIDGNKYADAIFRAWKGDND